MSTDNSFLFGQERWTATELGEALCLSTQRINQLVKEGILPSPIDGRYLPRDAVAAFVRHLRKRVSGTSPAGEVTRKLLLENEMRFIRLQKIAGKLVEVDRVKNDWFTAGRRVRDAFMNLPSRLSGVYAAEIDQHKIFNSMNKEFHDVLSELSTRQADTSVTDSPPAPIAHDPTPAPAEPGEIEQTGESAAARVSDEERQAAARWLENVGSQDIEYTDQDLDPEVRPPDARFNDGD